MHSWNMGYDTDTNYNFLYFRQLNPHRLRFNFLAQGLAFPKIDNNFNACELGFGNGLSVIMHGAASCANWYGNDFNPSQVEFANLFASHGSVKVNLSDDAFDEFLKRDDLPMFDYICLHGIWSWISPENQDVIVEFVKTKLKVGGILYISYNIKAGFGRIEPFRFLINSYIKNLGDPSKNNVQNVPAALDFIDKLLKLNPEFINKAPWTQGIYTSYVLRQDHEYIGHEFANGYWLLQNFNMVANKFEQAKLSYVGQAGLINNMDELCLSKKKQEALKPYLKSPMLNQIKDFINGNSFRSDVYVKGAVNLSTRMQNKELDDTYFICTTNLDRSSISIDLAGSKHEIDLKKLAPLVEILKDYRTHSYKELREKLCTSSIFSEEQLFKNVVYFVACSVIAPAIPPHMIDKDIAERCLKLNHYILKGNNNESVMALASPVLGGGFEVDDLDKVLINLATKIDDLDVNTIKAVIERVLDTKNNQQTQDEIEQYAERFLTFKMPLFKNLMII